MICGHTGCGGINALIDGTPKDTKIHDWLKHACPAKKTAKNSRTYSFELETIKENIFLQATNLLTFDYVIKKYQKNEIKIHKWLYDMNTGTISFFDDLDNDWFPLN